MLGSGVNHNLEPQTPSYTEKKASPWGDDFKWEKRLNHKSADSIGTNEAKSVSFKGRQLNDKEVIKIAEGLETNTHITDLDLSENDIEEVETIERLTKALKINKTLQNIWLGKNWVTRDRIPGRADRYANFERNNACVIMESDEDYRARTTAVAKLYRVLEKRRNGELEWSEEEVVEMEEVEEVDSSNLLTENPYHSLDGEAELLTRAIRKNVVVLDKNTNNLLQPISTEEETSSLDWTSDSEESYFTPWISVPNNNLNIPTNLHYKGFGSSSEEEYSVESLDFEPEDDHTPKYPENPEYPWDDDDDFEFDMTANRLNIKSIADNTIRSPQPHTVDMANQELNDQDILNLAAALETNTHITDIDLCNNNIRNVESIKRLTEAVEKNKNLQNICVEVNWVTRVCNSKGDRDEEGNIVIETFGEFLDRTYALGNLNAALKKNREARKSADDFDFDSILDEVEVDCGNIGAKATAVPSVKLNFGGRQFSLTKEQLDLNEKMNRLMAKVDDTFPHLAIPSSAPREEKGPENKWDLDFSGFDLMSTKKQAYPKGSDTYWKVDVNFVIKILTEVSKPNTRVNLEDIIVDSKGLDLIMGALKDNSNISKTSVTIIIPRPEGFVPITTMSTLPASTSTVTNTPMKLSEIKWDSDFSDPDILDVVGVQGIINDIEDKANTSINLSNITVSMNDTRRIAIALRDNTNITTINIANTNPLILGFMALCLNAIFKNLKDPVERKVYFHEDYAPISLLNEGFEIPKEAGTALAEPKPKPIDKPKSAPKEEAPSILPKLALTAITVVAGAFITWQYSNPVKAISILGSGIMAWNGYDHNIGKLGVAAGTILGTLKSHRNGNTSAELTCLVTLAINAAAWVYTIAPSKGDGPTLP